MKIYYDSKLAKSLLFGSFKTCMFFGVVLIRVHALSEKVKRHEGFMFQAYWECLAASVVLWFLLHVGAALLGGHVSAWWLLFVPTTFYLLYGVEWLISYVYHILQGDARDRWNDAAYHASAFEMEAYAHEAEANYLVLAPLVRVRQILRKTLMHHETRLTHSLRSVALHGKLFTQQGIGAKPPDR